MDNHGWMRKESTEPLLIREKDGVTGLLFSALENSGMVNHAFSTRIGGVSEGNFASMNFSFTRGDNPEHVKENYRRMAQFLNVDMQRMVLSHQTHTTNVRVVTEADAGKGVVRERDYQDVDGLVTNVPGITLVTFYADCVPLYILDPVHQAIGLSHSGWRGTVNRMGEETLRVMNRVYGTKTSEVIVCIGPSICRDCFEVGKEVADCFEPNLSYRKENGKYQLDLWWANQNIFLNAGVLKEQIHITDICTKCNSKWLFSHRKHGENRGNLAAFLSLKE